MKVLYFHQYFTTPKGSSGIRSYEMAKRLVQHGHDVTMVCGRSARGDTGLEGSFKRGRRSGFVDGIYIIELDLPYSNNDGFIKRAFTFLKFAARSIGISLTQQYDVVFATTTPLTAGIPGILARWLRRKPFVFEVRDLWPELPREMGVITNPLVLWAMGVLEWLSYRSAHRLIGLSPGIVEGIAKRGVARERIAMIPNGCDLEIFSPTQGGDSPQPWRPESVADTDLMAVFTGTHGMANGLDAVLDAAAVLKQRGRSDIKLVLVGQGRLKPELQARSQREDLDNVVFHDPVDKARLAGLMASADLGMQVLANVPAFYYGTSPNKFFDYIAAGLPVLNNYPGWLAEMLEEQRCGFAVPPDDASAFADALEQAALDRAALEEMGRNAHALAAERFNRHRLADEFVAWLEQATPQGRPNAGTSAEMSEREKD
ncbi:MAG: glycosyltransferase family 4 protein [Pseudomonadota bacterium]